eukprot:m.344208 g.344208  ORF g.344208 m.344208 type:complete len:434 (+) comp16134_c2_seq1:185-1486(+)
MTLCLGDSFEVKRKMQRWASAVFSLGGATALTMVLAKNIVKVPQAEAEAALDIATPDVQDLQLDKVFVLFRHGSRTPLHKFPGESVKPTVWSTKEHCSFMLGEFDRKLQLSSPCGGDIQPKTTYAGLLPGGCPRGYLTDVGRKDAVALGIRLKHSLIGPNKLLETYSPSDVYVRSTTFQRTIDTANGVLHGMFGSKGKAIHVSVNANLRDEVMIPHVRACPLLRLMFKEQRKIAMKNWIGTEPASHLAQQLGVDPSETFPLHLRDVLTALNAHNKPLPVELETDHVQVIDSMATSYLRDSLLSKGSIGPTLAIGRFLAEILDRMNNDPRKLFLFSGHDTTVMPTLLALGIADDDWPPFCADIRLELYSDPNAPDRKYVRALYLGKPKQMIFAPSVLCPFEVFTEGIKNVTPTDYNALCNSVEISEPVSKSDFH